ncbi:UDP-N-acetylmuramoyl-L-alanyl-D-glutamate--2,6-diaminopimelate ligase [candidate division WOR-3 bacterium JGI_Cruoil_03_51_56]|uniref:UDP-N-acetylmuramoyl-L-alanyl-D-glutamate--2,6-diaminopimelate ligase n=1 Tax=candidate division WOR-3 bacterium JGI_Cruoil_03_51_56 TaxID=1973747 RepID=A0A235BVK3_UNCW3|nr:MAG: UDP-N-acetylmuramoyl-L-alanyl-D-glutamate--2,6-diaminopimelate ligase [candidate division WOR-3 bacterium JGI_Cruoil_03_51_56]
MKKLGELVQGIPCTIHGNSAVEIKGIAYHSARVKSGYMFVAVDGFCVSGAKFIDDAVNRGAVAVVTTDLNKVRKGWVNIVLTKSPRRFLAQVSNRFYGFPSHKLILAGITGTNGKTTTGYLLRSMAKKMGIEPGFIGTVEYWDGAESSKAGKTTPESLDLVQMLSRMVEHKLGLCITEVSSHGLELDRVFDLDFKVGVFTNFSQDHLDFHKTLRAYREAKLKLFTGLSPASFAVVNQDDSVGREIPERTRAQVLRYGTRADLEPIPDVVGRVISVEPDGLETEISCQGKTVPVRLNLTGRYNLQNLLAAFGAGCALKWPVGAMKAGAESLESVPGRLELMRSGRGFQVFVDYAHTPDALHKVLDTVREFTKGRLLVVFGCGGDRDRSKRPLMGRVVAELANTAIVTSDNPRSEPPDEIIGQIVKGMNCSGKFLVEPDRKEAIRRALHEAQKGDTVVIAGKGHEEYQIVGNERCPFDDRKAVREILEELG